MDNGTEHKNTNAALNQLCLVSPPLQVSPSLPRKRCKNLSPNTFRFTFHFPSPAEFGKESSLTSTKKTTLKNTTSTLLTKPYPQQKKSMRPPTTTTAQKTLLRTRQDSATPRGGEQHKVHQNQFSNHRCCHQIFVL